MIRRFCCFSLSRSSLIADRKYKYVGAASTAIILEVTSHNEEMPWLQVSLLSPDHVDDHRGNRAEPIHL